MVRQLFRPVGLDQGCDGQNGVHCRSVCIFGSKLVAVYTAPVVGRGATPNFWRLRAQQPSNMQVQGARKHGGPGGPPGYREKSHAPIVTT